MRVQAFGLTDRGVRRPQNQDSVLCTTLVAEERPIGLYAVADGMGGQSAGDIASRLAIETIQSELGQYLERTVGAGVLDSSEAVTVRLDDPPSMGDNPNLSMVDVLAGTMQLCNQRIREYGQTHVDAVGLGSTLTVVMLAGKLALIGNIGDSRTYMIRDGAIRSLTEDHSLVGSLVRQGVISENDVYNHPQRNLIYNALGTRADASPDISMQRLQEGDILVLCSDGLWEMVRDEDIRAVATAMDDPEEAAMTLVDQANASGGVDNISVIIIRVS
jgi:PPM family protein phosphatase